MVRRWLVARTDTLATSISPYIVTKMGFLAGVQSTLFRDCVLDCDQNHDFDNGATQELRSQCLKAANAIQQGEPRAAIGIARIDGTCVHYNCTVGRFNLSAINDIITGTILCEDPAAEYLWAPVRLFAGIAKSVDLDLVVEA